jgi:acyl-CoA synthetase (AMP-forming)/AMP-acid ligase II
MTDLLWPTYAAPDDLAAVEAVPLEERGLPGTTYELLVRAAELWPERVAISVLPEAAQWERPVRRMYRELLADGHAVANVFHSLGVRRADAVAVLSPNCDELITATLAAELAGIAAPVNSGLAEEVVRDLLARSGARVLVAAGPDLAPDAWQTAADLAESGDVDALLVLRPTGATERPTLPTIDGVHVAYLSDAATAQRRDAFDGEPPSARDFAAVFHTGGTTGIPKLALHTHANEVVDAWMIAPRGNMTDGSVAFAALPLFHVNALVVTVLAPLFKGIGVVWAGPLGYRDPALYPSFWKLVEHYRISLMSGVPTVYAVLAEFPVDADISSLQHAVVGASPLPQAVRRRFEAATGVPLVEGYGLTEATCASALTHPGHARAGSVGQRLPYQEVKVVHVTAEGDRVDLQPGQVGVLAMKGPTVFPGYVSGRGPEGFAVDGMGKLRDGWLDTGDLARLDDDGFVHLTGRAKDLIIRGGHNIDPAVVENALLSHPQVTGAQAVGRPDVHSGEVPVAFVTLAPGAATSPEELQLWARAHVPEEAAAPKTVTVLESIPVTSVGKPYKPALRAAAVREAVADVLRDLRQVTEVTAVVSSDGVEAIVALVDGADETPVKEALDRFAVSWRFEQQEMP